MKVYVYPADLGGCGYYRLIWPALALRSQGYDVNVISPKILQRITGNTDSSGRLVSISAPADADVLVFQRVSSKMMLEAINIWRANGVAVVMDIDDDMAAINQSNPAWQALHPKSGDGKMDEYDWNTASKICAASTYVTVSTEALLNRYARPGQSGGVLHNMMPKAALDIVPQPEQGVVGWPASLHSHPDDPQVVGTSMMKLQREGFQFKIIGHPHGVREAFKLDREPLHTGMTSVGMWPHEISKLQVAVAPLNDTRFNEAKSWLKMLECAAVGVPVVGSPRREYRNLHQRGVGLLANSPNEWYRHVRRLFEDDALREEVIQRGRAAVAELTLEANAWRWWEAWSKALEVQRGPLGLKVGR